MPLAYLTVWELTKSTGAAVLGTAFIVFGKLIKLKPTQPAVKHIPAYPGSFRNVYNYFINFTVI